MISIYPGAYFNNCGRLKSNAIHIFARKRIAASNTAKIYWLAFFCFTLYNRAVFHAITILKSTRAQPFILHKDFLLHRHVQQLMHSMVNAILRVMHIFSLFGLDGGSI